MANHEAVAALPAASAAVKQLVRDMAVRRFPYVLGASADALTLVAVDPASGAAIVDLMLHGRVYHYDSTDTTTAHDGVSVLVSVEGRRYKLAAGSDVVAYSVLDNTLTDPPGSPSVGDAYLVAAAATGDWSGHDDEVAVNTARGWEFITVAVGRLVYVADGDNIDTYYHKKADGSWAAGFGAQSLPALSVPASAIINAGRRGFIVENQTTNDPPGSPVAPVAYIIGPIPTAAWAGLTGQLAVCEVDGAWTYYDPSEGYEAYDKALNALYRHDGTSWVSAAGAIIGAPVSNVTASGSTSTGGTGSYTYAAGTAPTTAQAYVEDSATITYTAAQAGARLRFVYQYVPTNSVVGVVALFRDAVANAVAWCPMAHAASRGNTVIMEIDAVDADSHTYKVRLINISGAQAAPERRIFSVEEFAG